MKKTIISFIAAVSILCSCSDFLKEYSQDLVYANDCSDLMELLVGSGFMNSTIGSNNPAELHFIYLFVMDDDMEMFYDQGWTDRTTAGSGYYKWLENPSLMDGGGLNNDYGWRQLYALLAVVNTAIQKADDFPNDPLFNTVKGEAHFLRACYYYLLVNIYAQPYDKNNAATTPGVPLKLLPDVNGDKWGRASVEKVYKQIVADLTSSIEYLGHVKTASVTHPRVNAAKAFLGRICLYLGEWEKAEAMCDQVLKSTSATFLDLNTRKFSGATEAKALQGRAYLESPETIFSLPSTYYARQKYMGSAQGYSSMYACYYASMDLVGEFLKEGNPLKDLRFGQYFAKQYYGNSDQSMTPFFRMVTKTTDINNATQTQLSEVFSIRLPEIYLNMAEAIAMQGGRNAKAVELINALRVNRFDGHVAPEVTYTTDESLVNQIRDERRRELCFEGQRWFDLRRYAVSPKYPMTKEIRHRFVVQNNKVAGEYILKPYPEDKNAYVLPIPNNELTYNYDVMEPNVRDPREMVVQ